MQYKGYTSSPITLDGDLLHGEVVGVRDVVTFEGKTAMQLASAFEASVNDYLAMCDERGEQPNAPVPPAGTREAVAEKVKADWRYAYLSVGRFADEAERSATDIAFAIQRADESLSHEGQRGSCGTFYVNETLIAFRHVLEFARAALPVPREGGDEGIILKVVCQHCERVTRVPGLFHPSSRIVAPSTHYAVTCTCDPEASGVKANCPMHGVPVTATLTTSQAPVPREGEAGTPKVSEHVGGVYAGVAGMLEILGDPKVPPGEIQVRDKESGRVLMRLTGIVSGGESVASLTASEGTKNG